MACNATRIKGFADMFPPDSDVFTRMEMLARRIFGQCGFVELRTPVLEYTDLFKRSIGEETDVVQKEMFTFPDRKGRMMTMRPEATAGVMRAYIESSLHTRESVSRLFTTGPMFRYERPQKGRMRQFHQINCECLGSDSPYADADLIMMLTRYIKALGLKDVSLKINSLGCSRCRPAFKEALVVPFEQDDRLVRGLDYYCRTTFEVVSGSIGAQSAVAGGGRYDGLVKSLGGPDVPGVGFAMGMERVALLLAEQEAPRKDFFLVVLPGDDGEQRRHQGFALTQRLREAGLSGEMCFSDAGFKSQMRQAGKCNARHCLILGPDEAAQEAVQVKHMDSGEQRLVAMNELAAALEAE